MFPTRNVQALQAGASGLCGMSSRNNWKLGGGSLQVKIALFPASFSYPGIVTVNTCLLTFLAITLMCVTECCPQSHRTGGEVGEFARGCSRSRWRGSAGAGMELGSVSTAPAAQTAPGVGFGMGCARQSNQELYLYRGLHVQPRS